MESNNFSNRFERSLQTFADKLLDTLMVGKTSTEKYYALNTHIRQLDEANPRFVRALGSATDNLKMAMSWIVGLLCVAIDYFLMYNILTLLSNKSTGTSMLKILTPIILVIADVTISYYAIQRQNSGEYLSWVHRNLQYLVIALLASFSVAAVIFSAQSYNPQIDGDSFALYIFWLIISQIVLLIPAIMLHVWIIKNAEEIADAIAYYRYKLQRKAAMKKLQKATTTQRKEHNRFIKDSNNFVRQLERFSQTSPDRVMRFARTLPAVLKTAINTAMGRKIFDVDETNDSINRKD